MAITFIDFSGAVLLLTSKSEIFSFSFCSFSIQLQNGKMQRAHMLIMTKGRMFLGKNPDLAYHCYISLRCCKFFTSLGPLLSLPSYPSPFPPYFKEKLIVSFAFTGEPFDTLAYMLIWGGRAVEGTTQNLQLTPSSSSSVVACHGKDSRYGLTESSDRLKISRDF